MCTPDWGNPTQSMPSESSPRCTSWRQGCAQELHGFSSPCPLTFLLPRVLSKLTPSFGIINTHISKYRDETTRKCPTYTLVVFFDLSFDSAPTHKQKGVGDGSPAKNSKQVPAILHHDTIYSNYRSFLYNEEQGGWRSMLSKQYGTI